MSDQDRPTSRPKHRGKKKSEKLSPSLQESERSRSSLSPDEVRAQLMDEATIPTLIALGILTERGGASANAHRKIKQVRHFLKLLEPNLTDIFKRYDDPVIVDMGAGKAAISLALYDRWIRPMGRGRLIVVEGRAELAERVRAVTADRYERLTVIDAEILTATLPERVHLTLGLHACDLATDHGLLRGLHTKSDHLAFVPCCQAEVARLLKPIKVERSPIASLWHEAMHRRSFGAHLTNVLRVLILRSFGYTVTVTELTGWEHSLKNELILGRRVGRYHEGALAELTALLERIPISPWLHLETSELREASQEPPVDVESCP